MPRRARCSRRRSTEQTVSAQNLSTVSSTIAQVQNTYWDLVAAWRNVAIQEEALKDTIAQQHSNVRLARTARALPSTSCK